MSKSHNRSVEIPSTPFAFIWFSLKPYRKWFYWAVFFVFMYELSVNLQAYSFKGFVDSANAYTNGLGSLRSVFWWVLSIPALLVASTIAVRGWGFMLNYFTVYARTRAVKILFEYLSLHSLSYFNDRFSGDLSNRVGTVSGNVSRLATQFLNYILGFGLGVIISSFIIFSVSVKLFYVVLGGILILIPINYVMTKRQVGLSERMVELASKLRGQVIDIITNITAVQQYARRDFEISRLDRTIIDYREADVKSDNYGEKVLLINNILLALFSGVIVIYSFYLWSIEEISVGSLVLMVTLSRGFIYSLSNIGKNFNSFMEVYGETKSGLREIVRPHEIVDAQGAEKLAVSQGEVKFENVTFHYSGDQRKVFDSLTFRVGGGQKVGIVGTSGAGKSTLMKLLLRQHDVMSGVISIDSKNVSKVTQESLRENISIVPQEPMLFHRTIRENIMYGKLDATEEEMIEVAKKAQAHDFIELLPQKYDSLVGERGVKLSVGQRQRIAIARAFLKNAPILILDEATSALDSESEVAVQKALQALMEGKTVFAIAHRLSTLREMDRILVFKDGQIVEDGTHRTLLKNKEGVYSSFWAHQAGGFIKED